MHKAIQRWPKAERCWISNGETCSLRDGAPQMMFACLLRVRAIGAHPRHGDTILRLSLCLDVDVELVLALLECQRDRRAVAPNFSPDDSSVIVCVTP